MNLATMKKHIWRYMSLNMDLPNSLAGHQHAVLGLTDHLTDHEHMRWDRAVDAVADEMVAKHRGL